MSTRPRLPDTRPDSDHPAGSTAGPATRPATGPAAGSASGSVARRPRQRSQQQRSQQQWAGHRQHGGWRLRGWRLLSLRNLAALVLAGTAFGTFAVTYAHIVAFGQAHGQTGWTALIYPFFIDGFEVIVTVYIFDRRRRGLRASAMAWIFLVLIVGVSIAVNWASASPGEPTDLGSRLFATLPAIALLGEIKIMAQMLEPEHDHRNHHTHGSTGRATRATGTGRTGSHAGGGTSAGSTGGRTRRRSASAGRRVDPALAALLPAAEQAADQIAAAGGKLTRETLARQLRRTGQTVSNARACDLLRLLTTPPPPSPLDAPLDAVDAVAAFTRRLLGRHPNPLPSGHAAPEPALQPAREPVDGPTADPAADAAGEPAGDLAGRPGASSSATVAPLIPPPVLRPMPRPIPQQRSGGWSS